MDQSLIRNIAIIAHVDHGKTTLVDQLFRQSGMWRDNQDVAERLMDSMDLEKERGITIASKNGSFLYKDYLVNIIDTPGHADFGGQVERVLQMADGALLLVDAQEGPMPQTYFVLKKALAMKLRIIVVINKIDKPNARAHWAVDQVFELFLKLGAADELLDFPVVYASARQGFAVLAPEDPKTETMEVLYEAIIKHISPPTGNVDEPVQMLVSSIDHNPFLGRLGIGKITSGKLAVNQPVQIARRDGAVTNTRVTKLYAFKGNQKVETDSATVGQVVAFAGDENITIGETLTDPTNPRPLPPTKIDPPTISMRFSPNDSPWAGRESKFCTSRHIYDRLMKEKLLDVALVVEEEVNEPGFKVSGRGELHLSILIEKMRREGYEFQVSSPKVILLEVNGKLQEPYEQLTVDVDEQYLGNVVEKLGQRKGQMLEMNHGNGMVRLVYNIPTRGLLGYRAEFMSDTKGMGVLNYIFADYGPFAGEMRRRKNGVLVAKETGPTAGYALFNIQERGTLFWGPGVDVYEGMIVGENSREGDMVVNATKGKKLTNMRASGSDENIILTPPHIMSLEACIAFINEDELLEVTPKHIRLRKKFLTETERKQKSRSTGGLLS